MGSLNSGPRECPSPEQRDNRVGRPHSYLFRLDDLCEVLLVSQKEGWRGWPRRVVSRTRSSQRQHSTKEAGGECWAGQGCSRGFPCRPHQRTLGLEGQFPRPCKEVDPLPASWDRVVKIRSEECGLIGIFTT